LEPVARVLIAVGGVLLVVGIVLGGYQAYSRYQSAVERQQVDHYTAGVQPLAANAGKLVQETIVPELDLYAAGKVPTGKVAIDASAWRQFFLRTRTQFAQVQHPGDLAGIAQQFDRALAEYAEAVADMQQLAASDGPKALTSGRAKAKRADCDYGRAAVALTSLRRSLDLPDVATFANANATACK
jgi:hypothetical protein